MNVLVFDLLYRHLPKVIKIFPFRSVMGSSINDVTVWEGGGGQGYCDDSNKAFVIKHETMGARKGSPKLSGIV